MSACHERHHRLRSLRHFRRDRRGVSAVEFALIAPLMLGLYIGCVEISEGVAADRKVTLTAGALANLTSQVTTLTTADMSNILNASTAIMNPYTGAVAAKISCLKIDAHRHCTRDLGRLNDRRDAAGCQ